MPFSSSEEPTRYFSFPDPARFVGGLKDETRSAESATDNSRVIFESIDYPALNTVTASLILTT